MRSRHLLQGWPNEIWHVGVYAAVEAFRTSAMDDALRIGIVALGARAGEWCLRARRVVE